MKPIKKVALLHSMCGVGKASLTNMLPVFGAMGIEACPIPTVLLSTHTGGYQTPARQSVSPEFICACADHYKENGIRFDAIYVGYLGHTDMIDSVQYFLEQFPDALKVLDPIMGDHGTFYSNLDFSYAEAFLKLLPYIDVIVPNLTEATLLTKVSYKDIFSEKELREICIRLHDKGISKVIITSVSTEQNTKSIALSKDGNMEMLELDAHSAEFHGSGDTFAAVTVGAYLQGNNLKESVITAHNFVYECLEESSRYEYPEREGLLIEKKLSILV